MKIRDIEIKNPVIMAPMAGITNMAFRKIVKEFGAGLVYSVILKYVNVDLYFTPCGSTTLRSFLPHLIPKQ